ncbi:hypothetical protein GWI33_017370 [Rhynchophorus ferrugineus]|uniref:Uncharacterized protein n=1 Tax=Rhynchophorus ferrugineus TaxID=354439 RepID=A0A834M3V6_RHYFE|nr:hypothetical protein GWI33_017370 [Rhynchophorus ferrugineus]
MAISAGYLTSSSTQTAYGRHRVHTEQVYYIKNAKELVVIPVTLPDAAFLQLDSDESDGSRRRHRNPTVDKSIGASDDLVESCV